MPPIPTASSDCVDPLRLATSAVALASLVAAATACSAAPPETRAGAHTPTVSAEPFTYEPPQSRAQEAVISAEWNDRVMACLADAGITVTRLDDGWEVEVGSTSDEAFAAVEQLEADCREAVGPYPTPAPVTAEEASLLYDANLDAAECLRKHGVFPPEASSRERFVAAYLAMEPPWSPFSVPGALQLQEVCPQPHLIDVLAEEE